MSDTSTALSDAHFRYLAARTTQEDPFLAELKGAAAAAGIPAIWIAPEQAAFLRIILGVARAREVVEVGTLAGYSAISMARALPAGGRVRTIELEPKHAAFAREWAARSDAAAKVEVHEGSGLDVLPRFETDSADACFIDADKAGYAAYLEECLRIVRPGGLIMADNAFAFGNLLDEACEDPSVLHIRAFNDRVAADPRVEGTIVAIGDGCWVGVNRRG